MNYSQFIIKMKDCLQENLGAEANVETISVQKNNGIVLQGITIRRKGDRIAPTIYLEKFYEDYLEGRILEDILEEFVEIYEQHDTFPAPEFEFYQSYDEVKKHLAVKLVNKVRNASILADTPHVDFLNLVIVFYCLVDSPVTGMATILIKNVHMEQWGVTLDTLCQDALQNAKEMLPGNIKSMEEILAGLILEDGEGSLEWCRKELEEFPKLEGFSEKNPKRRDEYLPLHVLTNNRKYLGAACMLYKELLEKFAGEIGQGFYILPSSIHEVILLPEKQVKNPDRLLEMVEKVNETGIAPEDILSDSVYYYEKSTGKIRIYA